MFKPFKAIAKQNWINKLKKADWKEGNEPNIQGVTNSVTEVAEEFTKYYQMLYAKKKIDETELRKVIRLVERKKILKASRERLDNVCALIEQIGLQLKLVQQSIGYLGVGERPMLA